jgi:TPP-dependent pyruvate/acetoin dehydrogenase alpha subunit
MMKEIYGKKAGTCEGKGGSMHIADLDKGMMGANGILGGGAPLVCGAALAAKRRGKGEVGVSFVGDGASNQGTFLESLNLAAVWNLPVIFVVENNGYAESHQPRLRWRCEGHRDRAAGFGMPGVTIDGTDFFAVHEAAGEIIARARKGGGPALLECKMVRFYGHFEGDAADLPRAGRARDILREPGLPEEVRRRVTGAGVVTPAELTAIDHEVLGLIERAVTQAKAAPLPTAADLPPTSTSSTESTPKRRATPWHAKSA